MTDEREEHTADKDDHRRRERDRCRQERSDDQERSVPADSGDSEERELLAGEPEREPVFEFDVGRDFYGRHLRSPR